MTKRISARAIPCAACSCWTPRSEATSWASSRRPFTLAEQQLAPQGDDTHDECNFKRKPVPSATKRVPPPQRDAIRN